MPKVMLYPVELLDRMEYRIVYISYNDGSLNENDIYEIPNALKEEHVTASVKLKEVEDKIIALKPKEKYVTNPKPVRSK